MLKVSHKIKLTVIAEDFAVEVDGGVAGHNSLLQCPSPQEKHSECAKAQDGTSDLFPLMHACSYSVVAMCFLSTVVTFAGLLSRFHNKVSVIFSYARHVLSRSNCL